jgi:hypothetical protein
VNNFKLKFSGFTQKSINIPVELKWDYLDISDSIDRYEKTIIKEIIGEGNDFEVTRFSHAPSEELNPKTEINYEFYFYSGGSLSDINNWRTDYRSEGFTTSDVYYYRNNFTNSFFKLDLYDNVDEKKQTNYITIIIPIQQGLVMDANLQRTPVKIKKPKFILDYDKDKEGFFIYWLKKRNFLNINRFYMSAKFYDAKRGVFIRMMTGTNSPSDLSNGPQANMNSKFSFDNTKYFYYQVDVNYDTQTYTVTNQNGQRLGTTIPIKWFEYVNP